MRSDASIETVIRQIKYGWLARSNGLGHQLFSESGVLIVAPEHEHVGAPDRVLRVAQLTGRILADHHVMPQRPQGCGRHDHPITDTRYCRLRGGTPGLKVRRSRDPGNPHAPFSR